MTQGKKIETEDGEKYLFTHSCQFNEGVGCQPDKRYCERCGWNPEVALERLMRICSEKGIRIPYKILLEGNHA